MQTRARRLPRAATLLALALAAAGCGEPSRPSASEADAPVALRVVDVPTPRLAVPNYQTRGSYPQVSGGDTPLTAVNKALADTVRSEQRRYARVARRQAGRAPAGDPGLFETAPKASLISASSVVVSALIPLTERFPGGTGGLTWISATVRVASARPVSVGDLFAEPSRGLRALATAVRTRVLSTNSCVKDSVDELDEFARGFDPTQRNYRYFALTATGLAIGFPNEQVAFPTCGRVMTIVPYATLRTHLSPLAKKLVAGVRRPRR